MPVPSPENDSRTPRNTKNRKTLANNKNQKLKHTKRTDNNCQVEAQNGGLNLVL